MISKFIREIKINAQENEKKIYNQTILLLRFFVVYFTRNPLKIPNHYNKKRSKHKSM